MLTSNVKKFIQSIEPFTFLTPKESNDLVETISLRREPAGKILFTQAESEIKNLYIIEDGALEVYYDSQPDKQLQDVLGEGDTFGGISILCNNSFAVRTVRTIEKTVFLVVPRQQFIKTAQANEKFSEFFTHTFGRRMVDKSYWKAVSHQPLRSKESSVSVYN